MAWRDFRLVVLEFATVVRKSFKANLLGKKKSDRIFYITITDADIGSLKSLHTLFVKYLEHILVKFEQNRMVRNKQNLELFGKKWLTLFGKVLMPFWKTFLRRKQLFNANVLIERLSSFTVPKIIVVRHV